MSRQPLAPIAPPLTDWSLANATAEVPFTAPVAASTPDSFSEVSRRTEPGSKNAVNRASGPVGSPTSASWAGIAVMSHAPMGTEGSGMKIQLEDGCGRVMLSTRILEPGKWCGRRGSFELMASCRGCGDGLACVDPDG